jgi:predicted dehydrogenase
MAPPSRFLIVSLGSIGLRHLRNLRALRPHCEIAVLRLMAGREDSLNDHCDVRLDSMDEVRSYRPVAAIVASPASTHAGVSRELLQMGIHVLVEKPFADSTEGLDDIIRIARENALTLMIGYNLRFQPSLLEARRRILAGEIGQVLSVRAEVGQYLPDWRPRTDYRHSVSARRALGGGALLELSHEIDYIHWLFGVPKDVFCMGGHLSALELDVEDAVEIILEYDNQPRLVSIHLDFLQRKATRTCKFIGSLGALSWDAMANRIVVTGPSPEQDFFVDIEVPDRNAVYLDELRHFLSCVETGASPIIDGVQGYNVVAIIEAAKASMLSRTIQHPIPHGRH